MKQKIAVVGAGLAGFSCAQALVAAGHAVDVFEKSRGIAGRMSTRRGLDGDESWQCDHGAQYFTARSPAFVQEVARWHAAGAAALWQPRIASYDGQHWSEPRSAAQRWVGTPRMTSPVGWMREKLGESIGCLVSTTVTSVTASSAGWALVSAEQGLHRERYGALVLAVPAPQVVPLMSHVAPDAAARAAQATMRGSWAVMLRFDTPVDLPFDGAFINQGPLRWVARDSSKPGRGAVECWLLHASPEWSEAHLEDPPEAVIAALTHSFEVLGGPPARAATAHRWRYADTAPDATVERDSCWWDADQRLGLCGDWLSGGKVEGAWTSGLTLAQHMVA